MSKTGLLMDPYFSATKLCWLLDNVPNARVKASNSELLGYLFTVAFNKDESHYTDATNAACTMLFNIHQQVWVKLFDIPTALLSVVLDCLPTPVIHYLKLFL